MELKIKKSAPNEDKDIKYLYKIYFSCGYIIQNEYIECKQKIMENDTVNYLSVSDRIKNLQPGESVPPLEELFIKSEVNILKTPLQLNVNYLE